MLWPGEIQGRGQGQARPVKKVLPREGAVTGAQVGPNLICISHVYKTAAGHVKNNVFRKQMLHKISSTHGASVESQLQNATSLKQKWSCRHTMLQCIRCMRKQLHGQTECAKGQVRLPYSSYEGLRAYDAVFFLQKRTSQVPGAMQVRATRLQHGSATALCTLLAKRGTAPATCEKGDKWRGSPSTACVPCRATGPQRLYLPLPLAPRAASAAFAWSARTTRLWLSRQQSLQ